MSIPTNQVYLFMSSPPPARERREAESYSVEQPSTRILGRFIGYYLKNIRNHNSSETRGVIRQIQRLLAKGITLAQIKTALENYAADPWRQQSDPRLVKHIRSFFTEAVIKEWQTPLSRRQKPTVIKRSDPAIDRLARLDQE